MGKQALTGGRELDANPHWGSWTGKRSLTGGVGRENDLSLGGVGWESKPSLEGVG